MTLTERYIAATIAHLPADQRDDVALELQASIADAVEAYPGDPASAEKTVLQDLGDPERLAATYANRPLALIGPRVYLSWKRLLTLLLWIVVPVITVLAGIGAAVDGREPISVVGNALAAGLGVGINMAVAITVIFALVERYGKSSDTDEQWTVNDLTDVPQPNVSWSDTIFATVGLVVMGAFLVWQQVWPWTSAPDAQGLPIVNPELWSFVIPALLVVIVIEVGTVIARHVRGHWTVRDWIFSVVLNLASVALLLPPLVQERFLNRELFAHVGWPDADSPLTLATVEVIIAVACVVAVFADIIPSGLKAWSGRRLK